jgi:uncharacterized protein
VEPDIKGLVEYIVKTLVSDPDSVRVSELNLRNHTVIKLSVAPEDMGRIIGKEGRVANAVRTLMRATIAESGKRVSLDIE